MKSQTPPPATSLRPSSLAKRHAIVAAAIEIFVGEGFDRANLDQIAQIAGVSKQTLYAHFGTKVELFRQVVIESTSDALAAAHAPESLPTTRDQLVSWLDRYARNLLHAVVTTQIMGLRRLVIAEALRFPDLAEAFTLHGSRAAIQEMAERIDKLHSAGLLHAPDPSLAATTLNWLILAEPINRTMMQPHDKAFAPEEVNHIVAEAVRVFLAAYGAQAA